MANGLLKKIALAGEAKAAPIEWNSFSQIAGENNFTGQPVNYTSGSINFTDQEGNIIQNNPSFSLVYFASLPEYGGITMAVGGLDGSGRTASGWFLGAEGNYGVGLANGGTANQTEGSMDNGYWRMFVDLNGNGSYGTYDNGVFIPEAGEEIASGRVSNFQGFQTDVGTISAGDISGWYTIPEPSTSVLTALGLSALAFPSGTNVVRFRIAVTNLSSFRLECRDSLTNAAWTSLGTFSATGAVTEVSDTNTAPARFYRAVSP